METNMQELLNKISRTYTKKEILLRLFSLFNGKLIVAFTIFIIGISLYLYYVGKFDLIVFFILFLPYILFVYLIISISFTSYISKSELIIKDIDNFSKEEQIILELIFNYNLFFLFSNFNKKQFINKFSNNIKNYRNSFEKYKNMILENDIKELPELEKTMIILYYLHSNEKSNILHSLFDLAICDNTEIDLSAHMINEAYNGNRILEYLLSFNKEYLLVFIENKEIEHPLKGGLIYKIDKIFE